MKNIITIILLLLFTLTAAQELQFEDVVKVDSTITKDELYKRARSWVIENYKNEKEVLSIQDVENGELSGRGLSYYKSDRVFFGVWCVNGTIQYKFSIYLKKGRYKYKFHSFVHTGSYYDMSDPISYGLLTNSEEPPKPSRGKANKKAWNEIKLQAKQNIENLITSLKTGMNKRYEGSNNW